MANLMYLIMLACCFHSYKCQPTFTVKKGEECLLKYKLEAEKKIRGGLFGLFPEALEKDGT